MAPEHALDVERRGVEAFRDARHLRRRHEQENRPRVNEAPDQPRTCDAIDLWPRPRDPHRLALLIAWRQLVGAQQQLAGFLPSLEAALQGLRIDSIVPQPRGRALAQLLALLTD